MARRPLRPLAVSALVLSLLAGCQGTSLSTGSDTLAGAPQADRWPARPVAVIDGVETPVAAVPGDPRVIASILRQSRQSSRVMDMEQGLVDIGPRLTGSSNLERAQQWALEQFRSFGLEARLEPWGEVATRFDRGPSRGVVLVTKDPEPRRQPERAELDQPPPPPEWVEGRTMEFSWLSWTRGTQGPVRGKVLKQPENEEQYAKLKAEGALQGAWILLPSQRLAGQRAMRGRLQGDFDRRAEAREKLAKGELTADKVAIRERLALDGVAGFISSSRDDKRVWTGGLRGWRERTADQVPPETHVVVRQSDYDYLNSRLADGEPTQVEFDLQCTFTPGPFTQYNVVADIPGSSKPDEVVIISGHLDSWDGPGSRGATDDGTGSAVTLEAARLLATALRESGGKPARTVRFVLWAGEEQGLLGSGGYVDALKSAGTLDKVSACFVDDGGTNWQGGITPADSMIDLLAACTAPVNNQFWSAVDKRWMNVDLKRGGASIQSHGSSDHASFNKAGVPGFFWDEVGRADYPVGWHTQFDRLDLVIPEYLVQSAANSAIVGYTMAMADGLLPRASVETVPLREMRPNLPPAKPQGGDFDHDDDDHHH